MGHEVKDGIKRERGNGSMREREKRKGIVIVRAIGTEQKDYFFSETQCHSCGKNVHIADVCKYKSRIPQ